MCTGREPGAASPVTTAAANLRDLDDLFAALRGSTFRRRFRLGACERAYLEAKGMDMVLAHAADFVAQRLAPAEPRNDGKRHRIARGRILTPEEQAHAVAVIGRWLREPS